MLRKKILYWALRSTVLLLLCAAAFDVMLVLLGLVLARHVDNTQEVLVRTWLFFKCGIGFFMLSFAMDCACSAVSKDINKTTYFPHGVN